MARPDPVPLVLKLEGQGLDADQIISALTNMGFTKSEARSAIAAAGPSSSGSGASTPAPAGGKGTTPPSSPAGPPTPAPAPTGSSVAIPTFNVPDLPGPTLKMPTSVPSAGDLASLLCGLLAYTLFLNYMRYGSVGVTGWFRAKFMNDPLDTAAIGTGPASFNAGIDPGPTAPTRPNVLDA